MTEKDYLAAFPIDLPHYHARQAAHLRALAANATTPRLRARLLGAAGQHEELARNEIAAAEMAEEV